MINILVVPNLKKDVVDNRFDKIVNLFKKSAKYTKLINFITLDTMESIILISQPLEGQPPIIKII